MSWKKFGNARGFPLTWSKLLLIEILVIPPKRRSSLRIMPLLTNWPEIWHREPSKLKYWNYSLTFRGHAIYRVILLRLCSYASSILQVVLIMTATPNPGWVVLVFDSRWFAPVLQQRGCEVNGPLGAMGHVVSIGLVLLRRGFVLLSPKVVLRLLVCISMCGEFTRR